MIAFRVSLNDGEPVTSGLRAGVSTFSVVIRQRSDLADDGFSNIYYDVGGLQGPTNDIIDWRRDQPLQTGDRLILEVADVREADTPANRRPWPEPVEADDDEEEPYDAEAAARQREKLLEVFSRPGEFSLSRPERPVPALQIEIDGEIIVTAGVEEGVVIAMADFQSPPSGEKTGERWTSYFTLGGLDSRARRHFYWLCGDLDPGDVIVITVVETTEIDTEVAMGHPPKRINEALAP